MALIIPRAKWGARYDNGFRSAPVPADQVWLHHSVTIAPDLAWVDADGDNVDDDEERAMRTLEQIGENRFGGGISYTWPIMPSGRIYEGHSPDRQGAHTGGRNDVARAICFVGNYEDRAPTEAQLDAAAWLLRHAKAKGWIRYAKLNGGHRDLKATACPGAKAYAQIAEINRRAASSTPTPPKEDDMPSVDEIVEGVWRGTMITNREDGVRQWPETMLGSIQERLTRLQLEPMRRQLSALAAAVASSNAAIDALAKALAEHDGELDPEAFAVAVREASEAGAKAALESIPLAAVLVREDEEEGEPS